MRIGEKPFGGQVGDNHALRQRNDAVGIGRNKVHVVLDENYALHIGGFGRGDKGLHNCVFIGSRYARGWFIQQDQLRFERKGGGDIEQFFFAQ